MSLKPVKVSEQKKNQDRINAKMVSGYKSL